jgi:hypothetical protein
MLVLALALVLVLVLVLVLMLVVLVLGVIKAIKVTKAFPRWVLQWWVQLCSAGSS